MYEINSKLKFLWRYFEILKKDGQMIFDLIDCACDFQPIVLCHVTMELSIC